jgi:2-oxoglutarate dehydrogenase E2 component (dihydrolipoamide succinyltransferase)
MAVELKIPQAGESITEVQIGAWRKSVGEHVERDEIVVEIETDKASMELPAPASGMLQSIARKAGESARVGEVIALIDPSDDGAAPKSAGRSEPATRAVAGRGEREPVASATARSGRRDPSAESSAGTRGAPARGESAVVARTSTAETRVMPAARRALAEHGLKPGEVEPTGPGGRLLKEDVEGRARPAPGRAASAPPERPGPARPADRASERGAGPAPLVLDPHASREEQAVPMTLLRRRVAERLVEAQRNAALLTTFNEIDMSSVLALREERGEAFLKRYGVKLGFLSFFVKAAIDALKTIPQLNAEVRDVQGPDGAPTPHIVYKNYYDIGVAVSTERGLVVPVIRNAERLSFAEIERAVADLAARARDKRLGVEELQGGTFTISNGGVFGSLLSTPIINPPQSGILGLHAIQERPVVRGGQVVVRSMMYVALTYDHRIVDGRESVTFLKRIKECVEDPSRMLLEA